MSVTAHGPQPDYRADTRNARLAEMRAMLDQRHAERDRRVAELDREAAAEGKPGFSRWANATAALCGQTAPRQLMVSEAAEHARWCAVCGVDLAPDEGVVRRWVYLGPGLVGHRSTVAPVCGACGEWHCWDHVPACAGCGRPVADLTRFHRDERCCLACARLVALRRRRVDHVEQACATCAEPFQPRRADARYCSPACRQRAYRLREKRRPLAGAAS